MPREQIVFPRVHDILVSQSGKPDKVIEHRSAPIPHVTWHQDARYGGGWIQVMFECDRGWLADLLKDIPEDQPVVEIHSEILDRAAANRLIRAGRRARDNAYGKDE